MSFWSEPLILDGPHLAGFSRAVSGTGVCFCSFPHFGVLDSSTWQSPLTLLSVKCYTLFCESCDSIWQLEKTRVTLECESTCWVTIGAHSTARVTNSSRYYTTFMGETKNVILTFSFKWPWSLVCSFLNQYCSDLLRNWIGASICPLWRNIARFCSC